MDRNETQRDHEDVEVLDLGPASELTEGSGSRFPEASNLSDKPPL